MAGTEKNTSSAEKPAKPADNRVSLPREWPCRLLGNFLILALIFIFSFITITIRENLVAKQLQNLSDEFCRITSKLGFTVDDIIIEGRRKTAKEDVLKALDIRRGDNILRLDIQLLRQKIQELPWVRDAVVKRSFFPNIIHIGITERRVASVWQIKEKFHPIDTEGNVIDADFKPSAPILLIVGAGAPQRINSLLEIISKDNDVYPRIKVANFISQRRWNLILDNIENGITIKLPEENIEQAWKKLLKLNKTKGILKRKLTIIDLRLDDKVIVKLEKLSHEERKKLKEVKESNT